jgi:hypothetical protein
MSWGIPDEKQIRKDIASVDWVLMLFSRAFYRSEACRAAGAVVSALKKPIIIPVQAECYRVTGYAAPKILQSLNDYAVTVLAIYVCARFRFARAVILYYNQVYIFIL